MAPGPLIISSFCICSRGSGFGFRVQDLGCWEGAFRSRVQGSGFRVQGSGFRVHGSGFRVQGSGFRVESVGVRGEGDLLDAVGSLVADRARRVLERVEAHPLPTGC